MPVGLAEEWNSAVESILTPALLLSRPPGALRLLAGKHSPTSPVPEQPQASQCSLDQPGRPPSDDALACQTRNRAPSGGEFLVTVLSRWRPLARSIMAPRPRAIGLHPNLHRQPAPVAARRALVVGRDFVAHPDR